VKIKRSTEQILKVLFIVSIACISMLSACSSEAATAKEGDTVKVLYVGTYENGSVFDSSELHGGDPLEFTIGEGRLLPDFEQAVIGLAESESSDVSISAEDGYGPLEVVLTLESGAEPPVLGQQYQVQLTNGKVIIAVVTNVSETNVTFLNTHQLAGQNLNFEITLVEIVSTE